jgi:TRAP transporter TAXI family solute receptor
MKALALAALALAVVLLGAGRSPVAAEEQVFTIATALRGGIYFPAGESICRLVNAQRGESGLRCLAAPSDGSIANLAALQSGERQYAIVQSDVLDAAYTGRGAFAAAGGLSTLRAVFSLHAEPFTVVARAGSGIRAIAEVKGRRFNIGGAGSGMRATALDLLDALGWQARDFAWLGELTPEAQVKALCDDEIDAGALVVGHPNGWVQTLTAACAARLVPVTGAAVDRLLEVAPYYAPATVPGEMYAGHPADVPTFGVRAVLVTLAGRPEVEVHELVEAVLEGLDTFRRLQPALADLAPREMASAGITVPLHPGALRYFREAGLR